jgi:hypothetical protein
LVLPAAVALVMVACGGGSSSAPQQTQTFQNYTTSSDATLLSLWKTAQDDLAHNTITLNEALVVTQNVPPVTHPPDPRAESANPNGQVVYGEPDAPGYEGQGIIDCSSVNVPLCHGYTTVNGWVYVPNDAINNAEYEFENVILLRLGYDVSQR